MSTDSSTGRLKVGPIGRLGRWTATRSTAVVAAWVILALGLGFLAPHAESALSGAGWEATGSESVQARHLVDRKLGGLGSYGPTVVVHAHARTVSDPAFRRVLRRVEAELKSNAAVSSLVRPRAGVAISPDRHTAVIRA